MARKSKEKKITLLTRGASDYIILVVVFLLLAVGLIMVLSASSPSSLSESGNSYKYFKRQAEATAIGIIAMYIVSKIDYRFYKKFRWVIYVASIVLLVLVGVAGTEAGGARRWIIIAGFNFQPSEFAKIAFILFFAAILTDLKKKGKIDSFSWGFCYPMAWVFPIFISVYLLQNHFSATFLIVMVTCVQMFVAGVKLRYFIGAAVTAVAGGLSLLLLKNQGTTGEGFRITRIQTWLDPFSNPTGEGWQIINSLYAIGSGKMFGLGLGQSKQKYLYLPEPHNDFIFAILAEELGFLGCAIVILLFVIFIWRGILIALRAPDTFGSLVAIGIVCLIGLQAMMNIAVVTGTIPVTGVPLPFFSYGGTAMIANLIAVGILLNISRSCEKK